MRLIKLDLNGCKRLFELHERIQKAFDFPDWYGKNWDAFWDLLSTECDADKVVVLGEHTVPSEFEEELRLFHEALTDKIEFNKKYGSHDFSYEIES